LEEHPYKKNFVAKIQGVATVRNGHQEKLYVFQIDSEPSNQLSHSYILFRPESLEFGGRIAKKSKQPGGIRYKPSLEEFVLHRDPTHKALFGRLYGFPEQQRTDQMVLTHEELFVLAYCRIT